MEIKELITEFGKIRPEAEVIFGYGSGVKSQANDKGKPKQIDLIIGVDDTLEWHKENHEMNPEDYRCKFGYNLLPYYGNLGTTINYISYLPFEDHMFKIGIVNTSDLIDDLRNWRNFFLAGRFQKPIEVVKSTDEVDAAIRLNRMNALKTALLASGKTRISETELYQILCSLSFVGDWRQLLHIETKDKVRNIVEGSFEELHNIYAPLNHRYYERDIIDKLEIDYYGILSGLDTLPDNLKAVIRAHWYMEMQYAQGDSELLRSFREPILDYFTQMNLKASAAQFIKGGMLNGFSKSMTYVSDKMSKK